ncbi:hypothetical protein NE237_020550 [Protea cynaroides]|uniref:Uncharacterized protein n=1 Tax=Protea cynaroides TaxID=273540 RepID=A0A9Q0H9K7_9MAGN|nr:hypothetical protein NE237_020550 [Protea cynaroides]
MEILKSTCLVLALLFTSLALRNSFVHARQAADMVTVTNGADTVFVLKELFEGVRAAAAVTAKKRSGGRKLVMGSILMKDMMEEEEAVINGKTPKISGKDRNASNQPLGTSQKHMNDQKSRDLSKPKALKTMASQLKSQDSEAVSNCGSLECSSTSRKLVSPEYHDHFQQSKSKKLLEAANQIVSLIHMDYAGMQRPSRKPPINNHEPLSRSPKP